MTKKEQAVFDKVQNKLNQAVVEKNACRRNS